MSEDQRYIWRELRGFRIPTPEDQRRGRETLTFMVLDTDYCYELVFEIETEGKNGNRVVALRDRVASYVDRLNAGPQVCACDGCDAELPILFLRPHGLRQHKYCCNLHQWRQSSRNWRTGKTVTA